MRRLDVRRLPLFALLVLMGHGAFAATITVNTTADAIANNGQCTLREAITAANNNTASGGTLGECIAGEAGGDTIVFDLEGAGPHTITVASQLPGMTQAVTLDGGNDGVATDRVEISGSGTIETGLAAAFTADVTIRNLVVNGFYSKQLTFLDVTNFVVEGCYLGTTPAGDAVVTGSGRGIDTAAFNSTFGRIGGTTSAQRNVITSASSIPVNVGGSNVAVQGNYIGVNAAGTARIGSVSTAVTVSNGFATIGGPAAGARNVIVGDNGINFGGNAAGGQSSGSAEGNYIGTDVTGTVALNAGQGAGIVLVHADDVILTGNLISGNGEGVALTSNGSTGAVSMDTTLKGNLIGTKADGLTPLPNTREGVRIVSSNGNRIGGTGAGEGNVIAFNGLAGVRVDGSTLNAILANSIHSNGGRGITLIDGVSPLPNDLDDPDGGANNRQNYPVIDTAEFAGANIELSGTLNSLASTTFRLEFFASPTCDESGNGEGRTFLGSTEITTDGGGDASFDAVSLPLSGGATITATATLKTAAPAFTDTSEHSVCFLAATLDIDGNGEYEALRDGVLVIRRLFGFSGAVLTANAIGVDATRDSPEEVVEYITAILSALDIDLNTQTEPLADGLLALRFLLGFDGATLIDNAIGEDAQRETAMEIEDYLDSLTP